MSDERLGPLRDLCGTWVGQGLRLSVRPGANANAQPVRQVYATHEAIAFAPVGPLSSETRGGRPAEGIHGVSYVHEASDAHTGAAIFKRPGIWLNIRTPASIPGVTVVRFETPRHDRALVGEGSWKTCDGPPRIGPAGPITNEPASRRPAHSGKALEIGQGGLPPGVSAAALRDPNTLLREAIEPQSIARTISLRIASGPGADQRCAYAPIPFTRAAPASLEATYWIETVRSRTAAASQVLQLQYSETIIEEVDGTRWPQVSVGTLLKQDLGASRA